MKPEQLQAIIDTLRKQNPDLARQLPRADTVSLVWPPRVEEKDPSAELEKALDEFGATQGWLCYQSTVVWFHQERPFVRPEHAGVLLYGELLNGKTSLHIRENGTGGCRLTWL
ncbi:MAG: hypothetical protein ACRD82_00950, partial [Blastocatellia bacterium]